MSVAFTRTNALEFLCQCGCGQEINPNVRLFSEAVASGMSHGEVARQFGYSREYVSVLLRKPPRFVKGHSARLQVYRDQVCSNCGYTYRTCGPSTRCYNSDCSADRKARAEAHQQHRLAITVGAFFKRLGRMYRAAERERKREERQAQVLALKAERERKRAAKRARWWTHATPRSFDAGIGEYDGLNLHSIVGRTEEAADHLVIQAEAAARLRQIVGDIGPEDVQRMTAWDLDRLRERLIEEGLAPEGVQDAERERLREPVRHSGEGYVKSKSRGGRRTRKQRVALMAGHRPSKKQRKRWNR